MTKKKKKVSSNDSVDISRVVQSVQIQRVRLVELTAHTVIDDPEAVAAVRIEVSFGASLHSHGPDFFEIDAPIRVTVIKADSREEVVTIKVVLRLSYALQPGTGRLISKEQLEAFANLNAVFNAWPYWREHVHQISQRMELPAIVLPVYRMTDAFKRAGFSPAKKPRRSPKAQRKGRAR
jgi:hypothetical protein